MNIPTVPTASLIGQDGQITDVWQSFFQNLVTQLNLLSDEGYLFPDQINSNVLLLNTTESEGRILYNLDTKRMMLNNSGTFENILT